MFTDETEEFRNVTKAVIAFALGGAQITCESSELNCIQKSGEVITFKLDSNDEASKFSDGLTEAAINFSQDCIMLAEKLKATKIGGKEMADPTEDEAREEYDVQTNWTDEEIDVYLAVYGKGVCDQDLVDVDYISTDEDGFS